jgi:hypothetical protein
LVSDIPAGDGKIATFLQCNLSGGEEWGGMICNGSFEGASSPACFVRRCLINPFALCQDNHPRHTVKKVSDFPFPSRNVPFKNLLGREIFQLFAAMDSLVIDIPAGEIVKLFYSAGTEGGDVTQSKQALNRHTIADENACYS